MLKLTPYGLLGADLTEVCLEDLVVPESGIQTGPFGSQLHKEDYVESGTPIITVEHLGENRIIHEDLPMVSDEDKKRLSRFTLQEGDIVFSRVGSVDRRALVRKEEAGWLFSGRCLRVRADQAKVDPVFLSYFFGLPSFKSYVRTIAVGATMPSLNTGIMKGLPVYLPDRLDQEHIARLLTALDDKIEINRRMCGTLEEMARAVFKSWFVDFDPVRAKIAAKDEGRDPERAAMAAIAGKSEAELDDFPDESIRFLRSTASHFPDALVETSDGPVSGHIPWGWELRTLTDAFSVTMGQSPPGDTYNLEGDGLPFYQGRTDFGLRFPSERVFCNAPTRVARMGDTLMSVRAPVGTINRALGDCAIGRGVGAFRHKSGSTCYTYYAMDAFAPKFDLFESEGTVFGSVSKRDLQRLSVIEPSPDCITAFDDQWTATDQEIACLYDSAKTLARLRDALLPRLLSGEIDVGGLTDA